MKTITANLAYLYDILGYMIEGQYWENSTPEDYQDFIERYQDISNHRQNNEKAKEEFRQGLKTVLKAILNNPETDYDKLFLDGAMHSFGSGDEAKQVFEMIWYSFFDNENWRDVQFETSEIVFTDEPFCG